MISLEDCVALSGLTEEQVLAIAEHEHLPEIAATALAQYLLKREHGMEKIRDMIVDDIRQAQRRQDKAHILTLLHVLHHFLKSHPEVCPPQHPWSELYLASTVHATGMTAGGPLHQRSRCQRLPEQSQEREVLPLPDPGIAVETRPGAGFCSGLVGPAASSAVDV